MKHFIHKFLTEDDKLVELLDICNNELEKQILLGLIDGTSENVLARQLRIGNTTYQYVRNSLFTRIRKNYVR